MIYWLIKNNAGALYILNAKLGIKQQRLMSPTSLEMLSIKTIKKTLAQIKFKGSAGDSHSILRGTFKKDIFIISKDFLQEKK